MYLHLSKAVFLSSIKYHFASLNMSLECLLRDLVFNNAIVSV